MELLALLSSRDESVISGVKGALKQYTVYPLKTLDELEDLYGNLPLNLLLIDTSSHKLSSLGDFLGKLDNDRVVLITQDKLDKYSKDQLPHSVFDSVITEDIRTELPLIVERALERHRFKSELKLLKQSRGTSAPMNESVYSRADSEVFSSRYEPVNGGRYMHEKVVVNFARMLTASFDMRKLFSHFIESVMEISRVSRMSIFLRDKDMFSVKNYHGIDPYLAENLQLRKDGPLASWLAKTGRIMNKPVNFFDAEAVQIKNEMEILQCTVSFPLIHKGKLIGIFNIDSKITEEPFYREEVEIIYVLCNYLAAAIKDIDLYHNMWYQKEFTNNIIASMSSGMIAIDRNEKITICNQQAAEILNLSASDLIGQDLRALPSPLGDILYETMDTGNSYKRYEVAIHPARIPVGINSYRLLDELRNPVGAGIIFSDLSDSKKLEAQRRMAEKLTAVNDLMAKIAHEVRNPLTSIQTYIQLLNEKRTDDDLQDFYRTTVSQSINRLDNLIDKLITFSSTQHYKFDKLEINALVNDSADFISGNLPPTHKISRTAADKSFYINADKKQLVKAMHYLAQSIADKTPEGVIIRIKAEPAMRDTPCIAFSLAYEGEPFCDTRDNNVLKPLLEINNLGMELNVPISMKIIEGHNGNLEIRRDGNTNFFIVRLPIHERRGAAFSYKGDYFGE